MRVKYDEGKISSYEFSNLEKHRLTKRAEQCTSTICQVPETEHFGDTAIVVDMCTNDDMQFDDQNTEWADESANHLFGEWTASYYKLYANGGNTWAANWRVYAQEDFVSFDTCDTGN